MSTSAFCMPPSRVPVPVKSNIETEVCAMPRDSEATRLAQKHGLSITTVSWEDNARTKNSCWGPCISDMTLNVNSYDMPLIRGSSNFNDETWDVEIENIPLVIGNEDDSMLRTVTLKEYLKNFKSYLTNPGSWKGSKESLLADRDTHVICSAQACFLPMPADGDAKFNVAIHNYQSSAGHPAVLTIVASANGTSAEILDTYRQKLHFNKKGQRCSFVGQRLSSYRAEIGSDKPAGAPMDASEKQQNMLLVIQVPLKVNRPKMDFMVNCMPCAPSMLSSSSLQLESCSRRSRVVDVEAAIISVGDAEGPHREVGGLEIERDDSFPVRVTMQYYKATSNGAVNDAVMQEIADELKSARKWAVAISSLVTETTDRPTEHGKNKAVVIPTWWKDFWAQYAGIYTDHSSNSAAALVFENGRFTGKSMAEVQDQVLDILGTSPAPNASKPKKAAPALPSWEVV